MSEINYGSIHTKSMMLDYLRMSGRENMAEAVENYCDDERGIVFNKHPATDEEKFSAIYEYAPSVKVSATPHFSVVLASAQTLSKELSKSFKMISSIIGSKNDRIKSVMSIRPEDNQIVYGQQKQQSSSGINNVETTTEIQEKCATFKNSDHLYDVLAPDGKGKFQKFIGEDFIYVLLEDGTHNCYPMNLVKYNPAYIKANPLYVMNKNCNDIALQHTRNILKANGNDLCKIETNHSKQKKLSDEFLDFPEETNYMKEYLKRNALKEDTFQNNYFIHLQTKNQISQTTQNDESEEKKYVEDPTCNPIKKNIQVTTMNNIYQVQRIEPYKTVEEEIIDENATCEACC